MSGAGSSEVSTLGEPQRESAERPLLGKVVDQRFRVLAHIGSGGMADVYEVEHIALGRLLAMKVLRQTRGANPQLARRFSREARSASRIDSEHLVSIHDYGTLPDGYPYFVMERLRGQNLRQLLQAESRLPVARAVNIGIDVCLGLHAAHGAGLVHRDLKPENLWLSSGDDGREICILLDFGVARFDGAESTADGVLVGTARYMSPEQISSQGPLGPSSDVFSLGVILYECLAGAAPFVADSLERTLYRILNEEPRSLLEVAAEVPAELAGVLETAIAKSPAKRFSSALELAASLRPFAGMQRLLPAGGPAPGSVLSEHTLAEADPELRPGEVPSYSGDGVVAGRAPLRTKQPALGFFALGLVLGGLLIWFWSRQAGEGEPRQAASALTTAPAAPPALVSPSASPELADAIQLAPPASPVSLATPPSAQQQPVPPAPARSPARSDPPRPHFDGRNPYLK